MFLGSPVKSEKCHLGPFNIDATNYEEHVLWRWSSFEAGVTGSLWTSSLADYYLPGSTYVLSTLVGLYLKAIVVTLLIVWWLLCP